MPRNGQMVEVITVAQRQTVGNSPLIPWDQIKQLIQITPLVLPAFARCFLCWALTSLPSRRWLCPANVKCASPTIRFNHSTSYYSRLELLCPRPVCTRCTHYTPQLTRPESTFALNFIIEWWRRQWRQWLQRHWQRRYHTWAGQTLDARVSSAKLCLHTLSLSSIFIWCCVLTTAMELFIRVSHGDGSHEAINTLTQRIYHDNAEAIKKRSWTSSNTRNNNTK